MPRTIRGAQAPHASTGVGVVHPGAPARRDVGALSLPAQQRAMSAVLVATDALALALAFQFAFWIRFRLQLTAAPDVVPDPGFYQQLGMVLVPLWLLLFRLVGLYDPLARRGGSAETGRTFHVCTVATMLVIVGTFIAPAFVISRVWLIAVWLLSFLLVAANRLAARRLVYWCRRRGYLLTPAVIVGTNEEAQSLASFLSDVQASGVRTVGYVLTEQRGPLPTRDSLPVLGTVGEIASLVRQHEVTDVIVAITALSREELLSLSEILDTSSVQLRLSSGLYELLTTRVTVQTLGYVPLMTLHKHRLETGEAVVKAVLEYAIASAALLVLAPLFLGIALAIKRESPGPVFHRRRVLGSAGRQFDAFKFRTMFVNGAELLASREGAIDELRANHKLKDDPRVTRVGRWLRRYSLDELPQLFNVLRGQMALVGPRMISPDEAVKYGRQRMTLFAVKPGITGLWQVSGRSDLSYEERVRFDMYYVRNYTIWLDVQILFQTVPAVLGGRGAY